MAEGDNQVTAADWTAVADWVVAASILTGLISWLWRQRQAAAAWFTRRWRRKVATVLDSEVTAEAAWESVSQTPEVSMESGVAYARTAARSGHPPYTVTQGRVSADQPLGYLLAKTAETVGCGLGRAVRTRALPGPGPQLHGRPDGEGRCQSGAGLRAWRADRARPSGRERLAGSARRPPKGKRTAHGTGASHLCLLERKHQVEDAIYRMRVEGSS